MSDQNLPRPAGDVVEDGVPATEEVRDETLRTGDAGLADMPAPDRPWASADWGTTEAEQRLDEPLDRRLARERPDGMGLDGAGGARIVEPGDDLSGDEEAAAVGDLDFGDYDTLAPEEAAMSVRDDDSALGLNYDADPGYLEDDQH